MFLVLNDKEDDNQIIELAFRILNLKYQIIKTKKDFIDTISEIVDKKYKSNSLNQVIILNKINKEFDVYKKENK